MPTHTTPAVSMLGPLSAPVSTNALDSLTVNMAYRTEDGREVTVVFNGNEDDFDAELVPFRDERGAVRIAETVVGSTGGPVYGWYTGSLTPLRWTRTPAVVQFKDEGDLDGDTVGPMRILFEGEDAHRLRPYRPERKRAPWVTRDHAVLVAANLGLRVQES